MRRARASRLSSILLCGCAAGLLSACAEADDGSASRAVEPGVGEDRPAAAARESEALVDAAGCSIVEAGEGFCSAPMFPASTLSVVVFVVTVTEPMLDGVLGLSHGEPSGFDDLAVAVRFAPSNVIDARDGVAYRADEVFPYAPGRTYRVHVVSDVLSHTYSVYVHERELTPIQIARGYAFRPSQCGVPVLDTISAIVDGPSGQIVMGASATDTSTVAYSREGRYSVATLPGQQAILSDRAATTWKLGPDGRVLRRIARGGEVAADEAGNVYVARVRRGKLAIHALTPHLRPRWTRMDLVEPLAEVHAIAADATGVSISLRTADGGTIRRYPAGGGPELWRRGGGTLAALGRDGAAVATSVPDGIAVALYGLDGSLRWSRAFQVAATIEVLTLGVGGNVVLGGHYSAPITFGGPTLDLEGGNHDANAFSYAVALARADGAHVFTSQIPATRLTGAGANAERLVIAGEEQSQQLYPYVWTLDPAGHVTRSHDSIFDNGWGRSGRIAIDSSNRIFWELSLSVWGLEWNLPAFPYLIVLEP